MHPTDAFFCGSPFSFSSLPRQLATQCPHPGTLVFNLRHGSTMGCNYILVKPAHIRQYPIGPINKRRLILCVVGMIGGYVQEPCSSTKILESQKAKSSSRHTYHGFVVLHNVPSQTHNHEVGTRREAQAASDTSGPLLRYIDTPLLIGL